MAEYDLTNRILPYLDRHLGFPLLLNQALPTIYKEEDVLTAVYELAKSTDLVDFALSLYEKLHPDQPAPSGNSLPTLTSRAHAKQGLSSISH